ncbi:MAG TPA: FAD-binding oxidoreductase [Polyangiales bacterium]|jgi:ferredoxin-NADP reductase|nr:FAD-binding oxidoreductase [Polyangiales bacterium]
MRSLVVQGSRSLSPSVRSLVLATSDRTPVPFVPGQWVNLHVDVGGGEIDKRAYSIASAPDPEHPERFEIAVTRVETGRVSLALHDLPEGSALHMDGPHGFFTREGAQHEPALFVGTGTGVCPLRSMLLAELRSNEGPPVALLFGARTPDEILYREELESLAAASPRFSFHVTLSRAEPSWSGRRGYVQTHLASLIDATHKPHVYACGLTDMVSEVRRVLKEDLGFDRKHIHSERYD